MRKVILFLSVLPLVASAQSFQNTYSKFSFGAGVGVHVYQGDLTPRRIGSIETAKPGLQLLAAYQINNQLKAQITGSILRLKGDDSKYSTPSYRQERNFLFTSTVKEIEASLRYSLLKTNEQDYRLLFPYVGTGLGLGFYRTKTDASKLTAKLIGQEPDLVNRLAQDQAHRPAKTNIYIPLIAGVRTFYSPRLDLFAEANYRWMATDYLDGYSIAAGTKNNDKYYGVTVGVIYKLYKRNADKMGCWK